MKVGLIADTHGNLEGWQQANEIDLGGADGGDKSDAGASVDRPG